MKRPMLGAAALAVTGAMTLFSVSPAHADHTVSQADATAITIAIAGEGGDSGTVTATNDGSGEVITGETNPPVAVLGGQDLLSLGVLAQDATAQIQGQDGYSAACSGVAGEGGSIAEVGDSDCLTPGEQASINVANLDLSGAIVIDEESALAPLSDPVQTLLAPVLDLSAEVSAALEPLEQLDISLNLGAIQSRCQAWPGTAEGSTTLTDVELVATLPDGTVIPLASLPTNPAPNTKVVTDLSAVIEMVTSAVTASLTETLTALVEPLAAELELLGVTVDEVVATIVDEVIVQIEDQLAPLEENLIDITLNKQWSDEAGHIGVTALDLQVLPAAQEFTGSSLLSTEIATVNCGPNSRIHAATPPKEPKQPKNPEVPTVVNSGIEGGAPGAEGDAGLVAAGLLALAGAAGAFGYRRFAAK